MSRGAGDHRGQAAPLSAAHRRDLEAVSARPRGRPSTGPVGRSRSSAWAAGSPAASTPRRTLGVDRRGWRRRVGPAHRPGLGHRLRRPAHRRVPARRGRLRRGLLRHLAARGPRHGPAAAAAPGGRLGGTGTRGPRPASLAGTATGVFAGSAPSTTGRAPTRRRPASSATWARAPRSSVASGRGGVRTGPRRSRADRGHGLLLVPHRDPSGHAGAAPRGVHDRARGRRHRHEHPWRVHRVQQPGRARRGRPCASPSPRPPTASRSPRAPASLSSC